jgi:hypothetical protein
MIDFIPKPTPKDKKYHGYDYFIPQKTEEQIYEEEKAKLELDRQKLSQDKASLEKIQEIVSKQETSEKKTRIKKVIKENVE